MHINPNLSLANHQFHLIRNLIPSPVQEIWVQVQQVLLRTQLPQGFPRSLDSLTLLSSFAWFCTRNIQSQAFMTTCPLYPSRSHVSDSWALCMANQTSGEKLSHNQYAMICRPSRPSHAHQSFSQFVPCSQNLSEYGNQIDANWCQAAPPCSSGPFDFAATWWQRYADTGFGTHGSFWAGDVWRKYAQVQGPNQASMPRMLESSMNDLRA